MRRQSNSAEREQEIAATKKLAEANDVEALFRLATWHLIGQPLKRDVQQALKLLHRAAEIGHVDAALMRIALIANGAVAPPDWSKSMALLRVAARTDPLASRQFNLVRSMAVDPDGIPKQAFESVALSEAPHIISFPSFLSRHECAYLADLAAPFLRPSEVADPLSGKLVRHPIRTSHDAVISPAREDLVVGAINRRIAAISGTHFSQGEPLAVTRYGSGDQYRPHLDILPADKNLRIATVIVYLNDNFLGGETHFLHRKLTVKPVAGSALLFHNHTRDGMVDQTTIHAGLPVVKGVKWIATRWIRQQPLDVWGSGNRQSTK
jgi:prolyl 4-hydroxylase